MANPQELKDKLVRLLNKKTEVEKDKKIIVAEYKDRLKEINDEIKATLEQLEELKSVWPKTKN